MRFPARALFEVLDLEVAQQVKQPTTSDHSSGQKQSCAYWLCLRKSRANRASKPDLAEISKGRLWLSLLQCTYYVAIWVHQVKRGWEGERERPLGCFCLSHEKSSTVLSPSLNVFKFLIWLVLSNCLMG